MVTSNPLCQNKDFNWGSRWWATSLPPSTPTTSNTSPTYQSLHSSHWLCVWNDSGWWKYTLEIKTYWKHKMSEWPRLPAILISLVFKKTYVHQLLDSMHSLAKSIFIWSLKFQSLSLIKKLKMETIFCHFLSLPFH